MATADVSQICCHISWGQISKPKRQKGTTYWSLNFVPSVIRGNQHILNKAMLIGNWPMVVSLWWPTFNKPVLFFYACVEFSKIFENAVISWKNLVNTCVQCTLESRKNLGQIPRLIGNSIISPVQHLEIWTLRSSPSSWSLSSSLSSSWWPWSGVQGRRADCDLFAGHLCRLPRWEARLSPRKVTSPYCPAWS